MLSEYSTVAACVLAAVAVLVAARLALTSRPLPLRLSVAALRGWHVVDRVRLDDDAAGPTLDHVIVAPAALLAVTATTHAPGRADLHAAEHAAAQVRELARRTGVPDAVVVPVVLVSGSDAVMRTPGGHRIVAGVHLVDDAAPHAWLQLFREARIPAAPRIALARALDERRAESPRRSRRRAGVLLAPPEAA